jgi:Fur family zinc uptake transcriptional regulator
MTAAPHATHNHQELTKNQSLVFGALSEAEGPLSAYSILDQLREEGFRAPLQVYRALDKLLEFGMVHRLESLNAFIACSHPECESHGTMAFAICETCGNVAEFADDAIAGHLRNWARGEGFRLNKTIIELRGMCAACAAS